MTAQEIEKLFIGIPRKRISFLPTPFHKLNNLSKDLNVNFFIKREDLSGPSNFGGNKTRKLEFILGKAIEEGGVEYVVTSGGYQTNSAMECVQFCNLLNIKPIVYLGDVTNQGYPQELRGNTLLMQMLGAELNFVFQDQEQSSNGKGSKLNPLWDKLSSMCEERTRKLNDEGHKALWIPAGCTHPDGFISYVLAFKEIMEQSENLGVKLDYIVHATGTGSSLPGLIAGKLLMESDVKILSYAVCPYGEEDNWNPGLFCDRVKHVYNQLGLNAPSDALILKEINTDDNYFGIDYAIPTEQATKAIHYLAQREAIFIDPVYTGKAFAGLLDYINAGKIAPHSNIAFIHTGGTGAIFADRDITGNLSGKY